MVTTLDTRIVLPLRAARALSSSLLRIFFALLALAAGAVPALAQEQGGGEATCIGLSAPEAPVGWLDIQAQRCRQCRKRQGGARQRSNRTIQADVDGDRKAVV